MEQIIRFWFIQNYFHEFDSGFGERDSSNVYSSKFWSLAEMDILLLDLMLIRLSIKIICERMDEPSAV